MRSHWGRFLLRNSTADIYLPSGNAAHQTAAAMDKLMGDDV
ncbi:MAG: hypothetical protein VB049_00820 [Candidatus Pelethousia sp.]|nr:hypothetical protein [Candidatus Pelethousia sp.]